MEDRDFEGDDGSGNEIDSQSSQQVEERPDRRPFHRPLLVAAAMVIALGAATIWRQMQMEPVSDSPAPAIGEATVEILEPTGEVAVVGELRWQTTLPSVVSYTVEFVRSDGATWIASSAQPSMAPSEELLAFIAAGGDLRWRVAARSDDAVLAESEWVELRVRP